MTNREEQRIGELKTAGEIIPGGYLICRYEDPQEILYVNQAACDLYGCEDAETFLQMCHGRAHDLLTGAERRECVEMIRDEIHTGKDVAEQASGHIRTIQGLRKEIAFAAHFHEDPVLGRILVFFASESRTGEDAQDFDPLTGLYSRIHFQKVLAKVLQDLKNGRIAEEQAVLFIDLASFKVYNRENGMQAGDRLLKKIGRILDQNFEDQLISRFGQDHFVVLSDNSDLEERIRAVHDELLKETENQSRIRAGIYVIQPGDERAELVCDRAMIAADAARGDLQNYIRVYDQRMEARQSLDSYLVSHLDEAIANGRIRTFYQPAARTIDDEICSFEALARWDDPNYGFLSPGIFIGALEENNLIFRLDLQMVKNVCKDIRHMREAGLRPLPCSINLSMADFKDPQIHEKINAVLARYEVGHELIHIEITESILTGSAEEMQRHIARFHADGYQVWMDDFGSGYSSLNTLQMYDFDVLKLDMLFLRKTNEKTPAIVSSLIDMAKKCGISTLSEGVETKEQYDFLKEIGCERAQGYYLSRPLPPDELIRKMAEDGWQMESSEDARFYDAAGRTNVVHPSFSEEGSGAVCIIESRDGILKTVYTNKAYLEYLHQIDLPDPASQDAVLNDVSGSPGSAFRDALRRADLSETSGFDYVHGGMSGRVMIRKIAAEGDRKAYLSLPSILVHTVFGKEERPDLYPLFQRIKVIDLLKGTIRHIYGNTSDAGTRGVLPYQDWLTSYCDRRIFTEDRPAFEDLMDPDTLRSRILASGDQTLSDTFRFISEDGGYRRHRVLLAVQPETGGNRILFCLSRHEEKVSASSEKKTSETEKDRMLAGIAGIRSLGIFAKDADRRFLGANQTFLDYYGLQDVSQILGKTDEEMGWHIDPDPFRNEEHQVLETGKPSLDIPGTCIVKGQERQIVATKEPLYTDGRITGLIGYFRDVTDEKKETKKLSDLAYQDRVTGLLNEAGLLNALNSYQSSFFRNETDFTYTLLHLQNFHSFLVSNGRAHADVLASEVAERLKRTAGGDAVISRTLPDEFVIISQQENTQAYVDAIVRSIEQIHEADGISCTLFVYAGSSAWSETGNYEDMRVLAENRMIVERSFAMEDRDVGHAVSDLQSRYSTRSILRLMRDYRNLFDVVQLIDPETLQARTLTVEGYSMVPARSCWKAFGMDAPCRNCTGRQCLKEKRSCFKQETNGSGIWFILDQYVEVNGKPYVLGLGKKIGDSR